MGEIRLDYCCRLCLKEGFSLTNIFSHRSAAGDPLYLILSYIYDIKIDENDGLPSEICSPCMWRMIEFDACKRNVRSAEAEIMRLLKKTRPDRASEVEEVGIECAHSDVSNPSLQFEEGDIDELESTEMDKESEAGIECSSVCTKVLVKEEIDIVEWEMPVETVIKVPESVQHFRGADEDDFHDSELSVEPVEIPVEDFEEKCNERVFCQPFRESSQLSEVPNSLSLEDFHDTAHQTCLIESTSFTTTLENNLRIRDTNKQISEKDLREDVVQAQESVSAKEPKSFLNVTEPGPSHLEASISKIKNLFICDICKKSYHSRVHLSRHVRIHYDNRIFSCSVCGKSFNQDEVRHLHELRHLRDAMSEMGSKKKQYSCSVCERTFGCKSGLYKHSNQHSNKFSCSCCGKCFGSNADLKKHFRVHTKEKPFQCEKCSKSFNFKGDLNRHMASHSSDKIFSCRACEKKFNRKDHRNRHELLHLRKT